MDNTSKNFPAFHFFFLMVLALLTICSCTSEPTTNYKYDDNTIRVRLAAEPDRLNPVITRSAYSRYINEQIFMPLMDYNPVSLEFEPVLLKANPTQTPITEGPYAGGTKFDFELKEEAVWDDGTPVTAADVEFTLKLIFTPGLPSAAFRPYYEFCKKLEIDPANPKRFSVYTSEVYILNLAAIGTAFIYQKSNYDPEGHLDGYSLEKLNTPTVDKDYGEDGKIKAFAESFMSSKYSGEKAGIKGCGPYQFENWETGQYVLLTKKKDWWGSKFGNSPMFAAEPDTILFKIIPDQTAAMNAIKDQEVDVATAIDSKDFMGMKDSKVVTDNFNLFTPERNALFLIYLNNKSPKLSDPRVRKALAHLFDVNDFIENLYEGFGTQATGPIMKEKSYYKKVTPISYDLEKAKSLLTEAGWSDSNNNGTLDKSIEGEQVELEFEILVSPAKASQNMAIFFQNALKKANINVTINTKEFREAVGRVRRKDYEIYPGAMGLDLGLDDLKQQWHSSSDQVAGSNYTGFHNAMMDALIDSIRVTMDESKRKEMYHLFQDELHSAQPAIFLFSPQDRIVIHKRFEGKTSLKRPGVHIATFRQKG